MLSGLSYLQVYSNGGWTTDLSVSILPSFYLFVSLDMNKIFSISSFVGAKHSQFHYIYLHYDIARRSRTIPES